MAQEHFTRRSFLAFPGAIGAASLTLGGLSSCGSTAKPWETLLSASDSQVLSPSGEALPSFALERIWQDGSCRFELRNAGADPARVGTVRLFSLAHGLPPDTPIYAEGSQMLSQTGGTIAKPEPIGGYTDAKHYKLPAPDGALTAYNLLQFYKPEVGNPLFAFTSCRRFQGVFHLWPDRLEICLDLDNIEIAPGETIPLESMAVFEGSQPADHYAALAEAVRENHPPIFGAEPPQGWCSWYCFGPSVTAGQVMSNLEFIAKEIPSLRYIQIDDGYQSAMGDWLETGNAFGGDVRSVLKEIKDRGFEPAIWVAPFIAEESSRVFQQHPDWFMTGEDGKPLPSNEVTFGGWRRGPWYALDGTNPEVQRHFESLFRTMRGDWGVTYFKLDANFWGVMPEGRLHDPKATRVEAYRRGMEAVRRGSGDAFLLGCNHPLWPSLGVIHGSRSSNDISRRWNRFRQVARENLRRGWQNGRLWWNDPDVVLLTGDLSDAEFLFHAASIYASGGMLLAGDDLPQLAPERLAMLRKLSPPTGRAATFDADLRVGRLGHQGTELLFVFNWGDQPLRTNPEANPYGTARDFFSGQPVEVSDGKVSLDLPPHGARILILGKGESA